MSKEAVAHSSHNLEEPPKAFCKQSEVRSRRGHELFLFSVIHGILCIERVLTPGFKIDRPSVRIFAKVGQIISIDAGIVCSALRQLRS